MTRPRRLADYTVDRGNRRSPGPRAGRCAAWSPDKAGIDVGALYGIAPTGILAAGDV